MIRRSIKQLCLLGLMGATGAGYGELVPDDHGNHGLNATILSGYSNQLVGVLEYDTDVDVFSFPFKPWTAYTLSVETGTVLGVQFDVIPPSGESAVWQTNSVWVAPASIDEASYEGAAARWYMAVSPLFAFATGTYHLVIQEHPGQDSLGSGFPDAWEWHYFGDLDTADTELHGEAFRTGRAPGDPLAVDSLSLLSTGDVVEWALAPFGTYDLYTSTNLLHTHEWQYLSTHIAGAEGGLFAWTNAPSNDDRRFYHIRFRDD